MGSRRSLNGPILHRVAQPIRSQENSRTSIGCIGHRVSLRDNPWSHKFISTHWARDKMDAIFQTPFSNGFSLMKMNEFRLNFYWSLLYHKPCRLAPIRWQAITWSNDGLAYWCIYSSVGLSELNQTKFTENVIQKATEYHITTIWRFLCFFAYDKTNVQYDLPIGCFHKSHHCFGVHKTSQYVPSPASAFSEVRQ